MVDLPDLIDERQGDCNGGTDQIKRHEERAPRQAARKITRKRRDANISDHLDRKCGSENRTSFRVRELVG